MFISFYSERGARSPLNVLTGHKPEKFVNLWIRVRHEWIVMKEPRRRARPKFPLQTARVMIITAQLPVDKYTPVL